MKCKEIDISLLDTEGRSVEDATLTLLHEHLDKVKSYARVLPLTVYSHIPLWKS